MSQRNTSISLRHMLDHALEALAITKGETRADLDKDRQLNLALVRLLEIIGEAATRISKGDQSRYADISWPEIVSLRNRLIHAYDTVDFDILWQIVNQDLPGSLRKVPRRRMLGVFTQLDFALHRLPSSRHHQWVSNGPTLQ